ncbi:MAG: hypothetical protein WBM57_09055 [Woeseiaceae bacterium]
MSGHNIGIVLVRLFSIYVAITALQSLFFYLPSMFQSTMEESEWLLSMQFWLSAFGVILPAACAIVVWRYAETFVPEQRVTEEHSFSATQLMLVGVSLLGLYFFVWGAVTLVRVESGLAALEELDSATRWAQRLPYLTQLLLATPMILGRKRIAELLLKIKYAGMG